MSDIDKDIERLKSIVKVHNTFLRGCKKETISEKEIQAIENILSEFKQLIDISADTVFERNNFEVEALARKLYELGVIQKEGNIYRYSKKIERKEAEKDD